MQPSQRHSHHRGYSNVDSEKVHGSTCMKENFDIGNPEDDTQPNIWPPEELLPRFREFMEAFFEVINILCKSMFLQKIS